MSSRTPGIVLLVLSFPLLMLGITGWKEAAREADVRSWQLSQARSTADPAEAERFIEYAAGTLQRQQDAERNRNWLIGIALVGVAGAVIVLVTERPGRRPGRRPATSTNKAKSTAKSADPPPVDPSAPAPSGADASSTAPDQADGPLPVNQIQRALYIGLITLGLGSAVVIYTVAFDSLSESHLVQIAPLWIFPSVFGYYGLVAQRMEARLQTSHRSTVADELLNVVKDLGGGLGQAFAFLVYAPFLIIQSPHALGGGPDRFPDLGDRPGPVLPPGLPRTVARTTSRVPGRRPVAHLGRAANSGSASSQPSSWVRPVTAGSQPPSSAPSKRTRTTPGSCRLRASEPARTTQLACAT